MDRGDLAAKASLSAALFEATVRACLSFTGGQASAADPTTTTLARGVFSAMMISKLKNLGVVGGLLAGLVLGTALAAVFSATPPSMAQIQKPAAPASAALRQQETKNALAKEQLKLARQALESVDFLRKCGVLGPLDSGIWERRQVEALQASGIGRGELVSALESYVKRMKELAAIAKGLRERAAINGVDVLDAQYRVLEAEMWLNQEKSR
jgi:hypothetical protein